MNKLEELGKTSVGKLMWKYFVPAFVGVFLNALYNIVDRIFIGQGVGAEALSGVSVTFPIMLIMMGFGMMIGIGTGVVVSINLGKRDLEAAEKTLGTGLMLMIVSAAFVMLLTYLFKKPILQSFGATPEIFQYANDYLNIILAGTIFMVVGFSLNNVIRSEGNARIAMISMILSSLTNVLLDYIFIFRFGWGVKGAAFATIISMFVLMAWVLVHFNSKRSVVKLKQKNITIEWSILKQIIAIGMAPFAMQIASSVVQGLLNKKLIQFGGDLAVGAMGIINSVVTLFVMSIVAINMAAQPIIGFNYGAKSFGRVTQSLKISIIAATVIAIGAFVLIEAMPGFFVKLFNSDSPVLFELARNGMTLVFLALPIVGFQVVASNFFQSVGKAKYAMFATLFRQVILLIPFLFLFPVYFGINGIWLAFPVADTISAMAVGSVLFFEWKKLNLLENEINA